VNRRAVTLMRMGSVPERYNESDLAEGETSVWSLNERGRGGEGRGGEGERREREKEMIE
jgi:hypothetical protein